MEHDAITTPALMVLTAMAATACVLAVARLARPAGSPVRRWQYVLMGLCTLGGSGLFVYRAVVVHQGWHPLEAHVDGLLLIASLFMVMVLFIQSRAKIAELTTFALPVLTLLLAWAVCAGAWTFQMFQIDSVWKTVHLAGVYLGTLFFAVAAIAGGMFLYVRRGLLRKREPVAQRGRLASLEAIERLIVWASGAGFGVLTLGLVTGLILVTSGPTRLGEGWWYSPKIVLATSVWLIYGVVMNARHETRFRGARAAWLSIVGLVLLLATFGVVNVVMRGSASSPTVVGGKVDGVSWTPGSAG